MMAWLILEGAPSTEVFSKCIILHSAIRLVTEPPLPAALVLWRAGPARTELVAPSSAHMSPAKGSCKLEPA